MSTLFRIFQDTPTSLAHNRLQDVALEHLWFTRSVHDDNVIFWAAGILNPPLEESSGVFIYRRPVC